MKRFILMVIVTLCFCYAIASIFESLGTNGTVLAQSNITKAGGASSTATPAPTFPSTGAFGVVVPSFTYTDNGNSGASKTVNWSTGGRFQKITTTASCTLTFTAPTANSFLTLIIVHETSATVYTYTWPATVKWPSASAIATTNTSGSVDIVSFIYDGTNYYSVGASNFS